MKDSTGDPTFPIWLIGDSPPKKWADILDTPLDPRHPSRHNIWTSVADPMQDWLFRKKRLRLDTSRLYIRNAMGLEKTHPAREKQRQQLESLFATYKPHIVLTFGADAFRMTVLATHDPHQILFQNEENETMILGEAFRMSIDNYDDMKINVIPLLHISIALKFYTSHKLFVGTRGQMPLNYFSYVGETLASLLFTKFSKEPIWIE